ncbi:MAG: DNA translocase FtsK, partial [Ferruginibacter sp.]
AAGNGMKQNGAMREIPDQNPVFNHDLEIKEREDEVDEEDEEEDEPEIILPQPVIAKAAPVAVPVSSDLQLEIKEAEATALEQESTSERAAVAKLAPYDPILDLRDYKYPGINLLESHGSEKIVQDASELENNKNQIINTLKNYDIHIQKISATVGPTVTLYEIIPAAGVRISRIKNLEDDIALSLAALGIRIIAPIPGKGTIGIEVPNARKTIVSMRTLLASDKFQQNNFSLPIAIGKKIDNENFIVDLASMPHLLMAGATGQGKSVGLNAILVSLLYKKHPSQLKFVLIDPKKVELSIYKVIENHFLAKLPGEEDSIITDTKKVIHTLNALCIEMDNRYDLLKEAGCRNIREYNEKFVARRLNPEKGHQYLPFIVLVVDEFADLIMTAGKEVEMPIARLAQLARAIGIHLIIATQRPSVNIITGTIKANFPARIAFKVSSKIDSRTILDAGGAEQLIGKGDMLISFNGEIVRLQCAFVDTPEVDKVVEFIGKQRGYPQAFLLPEYVDEKEMDGKDFDVNNKDALFEDAARLIVTSQSGSTSLLQRRMKLGYNRAGRLMDQLEAAGIVGPNQGSKTRDVLIKTDMDLQQYLESIQ